MGTDDVGQLPETLPGVPEEARELFAVLVSERPLTRASLEREVLGYIQLVRGERRAGRGVDARLADALAEASLALLEHLDDEGCSDEHRRLIQAAVRYFVLEEDADGDFSSPSGFDDDAAVMNAVARHLGREDLLVAV